MSDRYGLLFLASVHSKSRPNIENRHHPISPVAVNFRRLTKLDIGSGWTEVRLKSLQIKMKRRHHVGRNFRTCGKRRERPVKIFSWEVLSSQEPAYVQY
jgi:hypothetical protein